MCAGLDGIQRTSDGALTRRTVLLRIGCIRWQVDDVHRIGATRDGDHRRIVEVLRECFHVDGGGGDDDPQIGPLRQQTLQIADQEVDIQRALVGLVQDDGVVGRQRRVVRNLRQQHAIGHQLDRRRRAGGLGEAHAVADGLAQRHTQLVGDAGSHRTRRQAPRLGVGDLAAAAAANSQAQLWQLRGLAGPGLPRHHHHLVTLQQIGQLVDRRGDRQFGRELDRAQCIDCGFALGHVVATTGWTGCMRPLRRTRLQGTQSRFQLIDRQAALAARVDGAAQAP